MPNGMEVLGTGHPNKFLQVDYAEEKPHWSVRVETLVPIEDEKREAVEKWLKSTNPDDIQQLTDYLIGKVPEGSGPGPQKNAKHMIAAAFGREYSAGGTSRPLDTKPK